MKLILCLLRCLVGGGHGYRMGEKTPKEAENLNNSWQMGRALNVLYKNVLIYSFFMLYDFNCWELFLMEDLKKGSLPFVKFKKKTWQILWLCEHKNTFFFKLKSKQNKTFNVKCSSDLLKMNSRAFDSFSDSNSDCSIFNVQLHYYQLM